ncbi:MAG: LUD domain-containing protein [Phycisphaerales bacterium]|nr:MAG: LUD domain-containing protein [Phycisphaerales bacterium]
MSNARGSFMKRVRDAVALRASQDRAPLPEPNHEALRQQADAPDSMAIFKIRAESIGFNVHTVQQSNLSEHIIALLQRHDVRKVAVAPDLPGEDALRAAAGDELSFIDGPFKGDPLFAADAGITGVMAAVAETGSIICSSFPQLSLVPPVHIAIVRANQIVPDFVDIFTHPAGEKPPTQLTIITGPSKTSDIEGILITGVHGPGIVHVCVVEED